MRETLDGEAVESAFRQCLNAADLVQQCLGCGPDRTVNHDILAKGLVDCTTDSGVNIAIVVPADDGHACFSGPSNISFYSLVSVISIDENHRRFFSLIGIIEELV